METEPASKGKGSASGSGLGGDGKEVLNALDILEPLPLAASTSPEQKAKPRPKAKGSKLDALKKHKAPVLRQQVCWFVGVFSKNVRWRGMV